MTTTTDSRAAARVRTPAAAATVPGSGADAGREPDRHQRLIASVGLVVAVAMLGALALAAAGGGALRAPAAIAFACLGPGAAVVSHLRLRPSAISWALVLVLSMSGGTTVATVSAWAGWWQPRLLALVGAVAVAAACLAALARLRAGRGRAGHGRAESDRAESDRAEPVAAIRRADARTEPESGARRWPFAAGHAALLAGAAALWLVALDRTDITRVGEYGLLGVAHPGFYAAVALTALGFAAALAGVPRVAPARAASPGPAAPRRTSPLPTAVLAGYVVLLILIIHGSTPALLDQPQYAWTFKHLGVIEHIQATGSVTDPQDIYHQWPALFAAAAQLADLAGVSAAGLAHWSALFFNLTGAVVLFAVAGTLGADRRVAWLTVFGFVAVNWVEEDYLSPQALAFLLSLGLLLILLRWLVVRPATGGVESRRTRGLALVAFLAIFAVLTAAHQLSPYLVLAQVTALVLLRAVRPWWLPLAMGGIVLGYLAPRYGLVSGSFGMFEGLNLFANASGNADGWGSAGQAFSAVVVRILALTVWGLAALAVLRARRRPRSVLVPAVLAAMPFTLLLGQSYGGEAIYRVFLFSAPWCVWLIAAELFRGESSRRLRHARPSWPSRFGRPVAVVALALALTAAALATVAGRHGQLMVDRQTGAEVAAARHLYAHARPGATIALATSNFPSRLTAGYGQFNRTVAVGEPELIKGAGLRDAALGPEHLPLIEEYLRGFDGTATYLVTSDGMRRQADYFGYLPDGALDGLRAALDASPRWSVFHRSGDVVVHELVGGADAGPLTPGRS